MNMGVKAIIPMVYAAAVLIGFLINTTAGVIIAIGGALISAALYTMFARTGAAANGAARRPPRQRNRVR
jgi:hypothetical protein